MAGRIWAALIIAAVVGAGAVLWTRPTPAARPNVILITIDTLRADHLSAYGYARSTSPHLEQLAREGVLFEHAYSAANSTNPSHVSLLTGTSVATHGVQANSNTFSADDIPTLSERLRAAGYATAAVVSVGHLNQGPSGLGRGFDRYFDTKSEQRAEQSIALARDWIAGQHEQPFFLWLHLFDPHMVYSPPAPYDAQYVNERSPRIDVILGRQRADWFFQTQTLAGGDRAFLQEQFAAQFADSIGINQLGLTEAEVEYLKALYDGEVGYTDNQIGTLLDHLRKLGIADNTLLVVTADHGEAHGEHGIYCDHATVYEETLHVPLIVRFSARIAGGKRINALVSGLDVAPTILQYTDVPLDITLEGHSLVRVIDGSQPPAAEPLFAAHANALGGMVRDGAWKLIVSTSAERIRRAKNEVQRKRLMKWHPKPVELYNLESDPRETADLAQAHPDIVQRLRGIYDARSRHSPSPAPTREVDAAARERLKALGYLVE
ncbi:MAG: sulfatase [Deltaproteobacteria bacterium]|nr:sulfatase [Deltaproteobacteria bacterium]